jgi:hypothetical protein
MDLARAMPNGASVADWLGTAKTAAEVAASRIETARCGQPHARSMACLDDAERYLLQALEELRAVRGQVDD